MKFNVKYSFSLFILSFQLLACKKDFLNSPQRNVIVQEEYVVNLQSCSEVLNGLYLSLSNAHRNYHTIYPELAADNLKPVTGQTALSSHYNWVQMASEKEEANMSNSSQNLNGYSTIYYKIISTCNYLAEKINTFKQQDINKANDLQGQVLAIRALSYFQLVNAFAQPYDYTPGGTHPGVVFTLAPDWTTSVYNRSSVAYIYKTIIDDLQNAIDLLPSGRANTLFFNRYAAKALLARVFLYKQDYQSAFTLAAEITQTVPLTTAAAGYPNDLFKFLPPTETEVLLQLLPGSSQSMGHSGGGLFAGQYFRTSKQFIATNDIAVLLAGNPNDLRKNWVTSEGVSWNVTKFPTGLITDVLPADVSYLHPVLRSSEMFLTAAEAVMHLNEEDNARLYLNMIRKRAGIDTVGPDISGTALLDSIYTERRKELAFEGHRLFDLQRWKKGIYRQDAASPNVQSMPYPSNHAVGPIPLQDVNLSGLEQNPGY